MASLFTQIIEGSLPGHFIWKDDTCVAFLSIFPIRAGHVLVVPRAEIDHWDHLPPETISHIMRVAQKISAAIKSAYQCQRVGLTIAGLEVPHAHVHLLAVDTMDDFNFHAAQAAEDSDLTQNASLLRSELDKLGHQEAKL